MQDCVCRVADRDLVQNVYPLYSNMMLSSILHVDVLEGEGELFVTLA